ncbi:zinc finger protein 62 homolog [Phlebotomus argentipes]|uniref:zinc finger protein 62 homolog n=1 Tax=Phlebotomus argentipes TaxID=94469 RepID=UPI002893392C|nr:zinc finger protein 62 homolog [Phlebotomus argentipes]
MGSIDNPLLQCHTIRDLMNKISRIHSEIIDHENTRPKCEICWQNHTEFNSIKSQLLLIVHESSLAKEEQPRPIFEYVQLDGGLQMQSVCTDGIKEEPEVLISDACEVRKEEQDECNSWESGSENCEMVREEDALRKGGKRGRKACQFCPKTFYHASRLAEHTESHSEHKPFKCKVCNKGFKTFYLYTTHRKSHMKSQEENSSPQDVDNDRPMDRKCFECAFCGNEFATKRQITKHLRIHAKVEDEGSEKWPTVEDRECKICQKRYNTLRGLKKHMRFHEKNPNAELKSNPEETPFPCDVCKKFFRNAFTLERHKEFRDSAKLHCDSCNEHFCRYTDLYSHQRSVHKINTSFQCNFCSEQFSNFRLIYKHHKLRHPQELAPASPFLCEMCGISMMDSRDLNRHVMTVHESKRLKCDMCQKTFRTEAEVEEHRRIHIPISQLQDLYECDVCPKKFRMKLTLIKHKRLHASGQMTEMFCQVCGKRFINANMLQLHMQKHANEAPRPFRCELCGRYFKKIKYLNQHRKNNHNIFTDMMLNPKPKKKQTIRINKGLTQSDFIIVQTIVALSAMGFSPIGMAFSSLALQTRGKFQGSTLLRCPQNQCLPSQPNSRGICNDNRDHDTIVRAVSLLRTKCLISQVRPQLRQCLKDEIIARDPATKDNTLFAIGIDQSLLFAVVHGSLSPMADVLGDATKKTSTEVLKVWHHISWIHLEFLLSRQNAAPCGVLQASEAELTISHLRQGDCFNCRSARKSPILRQVVNVEPTSDFVQRLTGSIVNSFAQQEVLGDGLDQYQLAVTAGSEEAQVGKIHPRSHPGSESVRFHVMNWDKRFAMTSSQEIAEQTLCNARVFVPFSRVLGLPGTDRRTVLAVVSLRTVPIVTEFFHPIGELESKNSLVVKMGTLENPENPLVHCHTVRNLLNRLNRIHSELVDHENTIPKCEICWQNHIEFNSVKAQLLLIVPEIALAKEEVATQPTFEYVQLEGGVQDQSLPAAEIKKEAEDFPLQDQGDPPCKSDAENEWNSPESSSESCEMVKELDELHSARKKSRKKKMACHFCSKTFYHGKRLTEHMARHTGEKPFKCETCGKTFKSLDYYASHCKSHEKDDNEESMSKTELETAKEEEEVEKNLFTCEFCGDEYPSKKQILSHMKTHVRGKESKSDKSSKDEKACKECSKKFNTSRGLKKHMRFHEQTANQPSAEETPYLCEVCKRFFRNSVTLERHKEVRDNANLNCDTCSEKFCRATDLYNHQRIVHKVKTAFQCRHCDEQFSNFRLIYRHHKTTHPKLTGPTRPFLCEMCGLTMVDSRDLNRHMMIHRGLKPHKCDMCDKTFRLQTEVEQHRRVHIPIAQLQDLYACDVCPKKFRMKLTLWRHKRIHTGQITEMFCQVCRRRFINAHNLEIHMLKHANEAPRPFKCDICGKYFKIRKEYNLHMKRKHGVFSLEKTRMKKKA